MEDSLPLPDEGDFLEITEGNTFSKKNIYSSKQIFKEPLTVTKGLLSISCCKFVDFSANNVIAIEPDELANQGDIIINHCHFIKK